MNDPQRVIVVDLDGTLCDVRHRLNFAQEKQWDEFHPLLSHDQIVGGVGSLVLAAAIIYDVVIVTGRNERYREATVKWLNKNRVPCNALLMRPDNNFDSDHILKPRMLKEWLEETDKALDNVVFVIDDRDKVVAAWREIGLVCLQAQPGSY